MGNRYPNLAEFSSSELALLRNLILNTLKRTFPNDASGIDLALVSAQILQAFQNSDYQSVALSLMNFGTLQVSNPNVIRNGILNNLDNIVNSFYALSTISRTLSSTAGQNLANNIVTILQNQNQDVSKTLLYFEGNTFIDKNAINGLWTGLGGSSTNPAPITVDGVTITFTPQIKDLRNVQISTGSYNLNVYNKQSLTNTKFYKINNLSIHNSHPQWNSQNNAIDFSIPCNP